MNESTAINWTMEPDPGLTPVVWRRHSDDESKLSLKLTPGLYRPVKVEDFSPVR